MNSGRPKDSRNENFYRGNKVDNIAKRPVFVIVKIYVSTGLPFRLRQRIKQILQIA
jgi:hypothetical protein